MHWLVGGKRKVLMQYGGMQLSGGCLVCLGAHCPAPWSLSCLTAPGLYKADSLRHFSGPPPPLPPRRRWRNAARGTSWAVSVASPCPPDGARFSRVTSPLILDLTWHAVQLRFVRGPPLPPPPVRMQCAGFQSDLPGRKMYKRGSHVLFV